MPEPAPLAPVGDTLRVELGQGDTLTIDLIKTRGIQGADNRQRNVQIPPRVAAKVRREAQRDGTTHVMVFFRALSHVIRHPAAFGRRLDGYRRLGAQTDELLGITLTPAKRTRKNPVKFQYNPTPEFDDLLADLANQLNRPGQPKVSKAVFVSLLLVCYYDLDVSLI